MRNISPLLLLLTISSASAGVHSKTLAEWCRSDILIGDPLGIPAEKRYDENKHTCTQTFGIFDEKRAQMICEKKAPFQSEFQFNPDVGVTCTWEATVSCPNENSMTVFNDCLEIADKGDCKTPYVLSSLKTAKFLTVLLRNRGVKVVEIKFMDTATSRKLIVPKHGFGKDGFVKEAPESWKPALVLVSEPMLKIRAGSLVKTDLEGLKSKVLCKVNAGQAMDNQVVSIKTRNRYQPAIVKDMHGVDVSPFHETCAKLCNGCYASTKYTKSDDGISFYIPVHRKNDKKHDDFENCKIKSDSRQLKQYYVADFGGKQVMADNTKWNNDHPNADCADGPRSAAMENGNPAGFVDVPPFARAPIVCTNEIRTDKEGVAECIANSHVVDGECKCKKGYIDIHDVNGFEKEKAMYEKGMYCVSENCFKNSEYFGTGCKCKSGFTDIHDIREGFEKEKGNYKRGKYCVKKLNCGKNSVPNYAKEKCDCITGNIPRKEDEVEAKAKPKVEYCVMKRKCGQNSDYQKGKNTCNCRKGFINIVDIEDSRSGNYKRQDGFCVVKVECTGNSEDIKFNGKSTNRCRCKDGFVDIHDTGSEDNDKYRMGEMCISTTTTTTQRPLTSGQECVTTTSPMHFVLVVDSSSSINTCDYRTCDVDHWQTNVLPFVAKVGEYLNPDHTTVTVIKFSTDVVIRPSIYPPWKKEEFKAKIMKEEYLSDYTYTREAIQDAYKILAADKKSKIKAIVLISDGAPAMANFGDASEFYAKSTVLEINRLKDKYKDVHLITVGIGPHLHTDVEFEPGKPPMKGFEILKLMASGKDDENKKFVDAGEKFENLSGDILKSAINTRCHEVYG